MDHNPAVAGKKKPKQNCFEIFFTWEVMMIAFYSSNLRTYKLGSGNKNSL